MIVAAAEAPAGAAPVFLHGRGGATFDAALTETPARSVIKRERDSLVWRQRLPDGAAAVCKLYAHRPARWWERDGALACRAEREFQALAHLERHGVPCSQPLHWARGQAPGLGRFELLVTREVPGAIDLRAWLQAQDGVWSGQRLARLDLAPLYAVVQALHASGLQHGALSLRNVLLAPGGFFLIDLPRRQHFGCSIVGSAAARFDLALVTQELALCFAVEDIARALPMADAGFDPARARAFVERCRARPMDGAALNRANARFALQAAWSRAFAGRGPPVTVSRSI